jgi:hypothetical protein
MVSASADVASPPPEPKPGTATGSYPPAPRKKILIRKSKPPQPPGDSGSIDGACTTTGGTAAFYFGVGLGFRV